MILAAYHPLSLIDFPGKLAAVVFTQGCNMACPYCHNPELLPRHAPISGQSLSTERFLQFLDTRRKRLEGVCITGGEPTQHADLESFILDIRNRGFLVKLDSNGSRPWVLRCLLEAGLVDYIAMDIKHRIEPLAYASSCGAGISPDRIRESIAVIRKSGVSYEFRTTVVPGIHDGEALLGIAREIQGARRYALQSARDHPGMPEALKQRLAEGRSLIAGVREALEGLTEELVVRG